MRPLALPRLLLLASLASLVGLVFVQGASGIHVRPKGATPKRDSLVISYKSCASPNTTHSAPRSYSSCTPPVGQKSPFLTAGTPDSPNALAANFIGSTQLNVCGSTGCAPGPPGTSDIKVSVAVQDVRCTATLAGVNPAVCPGGPNGAYIGSLGANFPSQLTDHCNGTPAPACPAPAPPPANAGTGPAPGPFSLPVTFIVPCGPGGPAGSGICGLTSTYNAVTPGFVVTNARQNFEIGRVTVDDGGPDGNAATLDNVEFAGAGVFVP